MNVKRRGTGECQWVQGSKQTQNSNNPSITCYPTVVGAKLLLHHLIFWSSELDHTGWYTATFTHNIFYLLQYIQEPFCINLVSSHHQCSASSFDHQQTQFSVCDASSYVLNVKHHHFTWASSGFVLLADRYHEEIWLCFVCVCVPGNMSLIITAPNLLWACCIFVGGGEGRAEIPNISSV